MFQGPYISIYNNLCIKSVDLDSALIKHHHRDLDRNRRTLIEV